MGSCRRFALLFLLGFVACAAATVAQAATGTLLQGSTLYPRVVRLIHGPVNTYGRLIASTNGTMFQSTDNGASWSSLGTVPTVSGSTEGEFEVAPCVFATSG
ncbi:hypothetical protein [Dyella sp. Tek66A03]|uniref:hypothetical protein n=1 Tax=Dyella sp. Tek66A03 TaxID=3458298 RepID=UPI00403EE52C